MSKKNNLEYIGIKGLDEKWNLTPAQLIEETILLGEGHLSSTGALSIKTGTFTGRAPKDRFIVKDKFTQDKVWWGDVNQPFSLEDFDNLYNKVIDYLNTQSKVYIRDLHACADPKYLTKVRAITEKPWSNLFVYNMFLRPSQEELENFSPEWTIIAVPSFEANPKTDKTRAKNFAILNFSRKTLLIGGTGYTGEMKKGIFSALNFILPVEKNVLPMHCSSNVGKKGDTAIFFGLSGTGKTTLSSDPSRSLIGDDEHGWTENSVFNFEGGCYAKCINLSEDKEPEIYRAVKFGALLENIVFKPRTSEVDYNDKSITENTRVSYPIHYIDGIMPNSKGGAPKNIFFLTADAFGVLPPISKLTKEQAMYHFISGYTAKVAGTEEGITEPQTTFSACFGSPFLPLHPTEYAEMLGKKISQSKVNVWLINTGWTGGGYGVGERISLKHTRAMISAALSGKLDNVEYSTHSIFRVAIPTSCPEVDNNILEPSKTWGNKEEYTKKANQLAQSFINNFKQFSEHASEALINAGPKVNEKA